MPQDEGFPVQAGASPAVPALAEANTESLFSSFVEPQCGHFVPFQLLDRARISLSFSHFSQ
jgi:hypothetical protein